MSLRGRSLDNPINWSFRIGRVWGIDIRLHLLFVLGAFYLLFRAAGEGQASIGFTYALIDVGILFGSVLLHEFGHCWGARRAGGTADEILLWPLGGLAMVSPPHNPSAHALTVVAGPMVNVILCCVTAVTMTAAGGLGAVPWNPFDPFMPVGGLAYWLPGMGWWVVRGVFTINYFLLLFNMLPTYPMDGGRLLQCWLWPRKGYTQATMTAAGVGMVGAIAFGVMGLFTHSMLLFALAIFGYMTCYRERQTARMEMVDNVGELGYDFSQGYTSLERETVRPKRPGYFARRRIHKEQVRRQREAERREELARRVDAILTKISNHGIQSLTSEERRILKEETERQRSSKT